MSFAWMTSVLVPVSLKVIFSLSPRSRLMPLNEASSASLSSWSLQLVELLDQVLCARRCRRSCPCWPSRRACSWCRLRRRRSGPSSRGSRCAACRCRSRRDLALRLVLALIAVTSCVDRLDRAGDRRQPYRRSTCCRRELVVPRRAVDSCRAGDSRHCRWRCSIVSRAGRVETSSVVMPSDAAEPWSVVEHWSTGRVVDTPSVAAMTVHR